MMQEQVKRRWPSLDGRVGTTLALGAVSGVITVYVSFDHDIHYLLTFLLAMHLCLLIVYVPETHLRAS